MYNGHPSALNVRLGGAVLLLAALSVAPGCTKHDNDQVAWARAALERNPQLEVVATDAEAQTFTVKHRGSGEVRVINLDKLAAAPIADFTSASAPTPAPASAPQPSAATATAANESLPATPAREPEVASAPPSEMSAPPAEQMANDDSYVIQREGGQLRVSGPGVSIVSANTGGTARATAAANTRSETPIVCEAGRFLHLDRRNISVDGNAVIARNGCELHITNSTIDAAGAAITVQDATVHIANSQVTGQTASIEANGRARLFARGSTFRGITRRNDPAEINDQGGNTWR